MNYNNVPAHTEILSELKNDYFKEEFEVSLLIDGVKVGITYNTAESENDDYPNTVATVVANNKLKSLMASYPDLIMFGTITGPDINDNQEKLGRNIFYMTDLFDIKTNSYINPKLRTSSYIPNSENKFNYYDDMQSRIMAMGSYLQQIPYRNIFVPFVRLNGLTKDKEDIDGDLSGFAMGDSIIVGVKRKGLMFKHTKSDFMFKVLNPDLNNIEPPPAARKIRKKK